VEPETGTPTAPAQPAPSGSEPRRTSLPAGVARFVGRHPAGVVQGLFIALLAIVVLQNLEPTSLDVLFWSVPALPKLVVMLVAMLAGGALWEIARRLITR
jgi:uncharacterized integral membrane protein